MSLERAITGQVTLSDLTFGDTLVICFGHSPLQLPTVEAIYQEQRDLVLLLLSTLLLTITSLSFLCLILLSLTPIPLLQSRHSSLAKLRIPHVEAIQRIGLHNSRKLDLFLDLSAAVRFLD
jgi:hypothetical protein